MGSKGPVPPHLVRMPLPGLGLMHPDPFGRSIRPSPGAYPPFNILPPPEVLEQKLSVQYVEIRRLATENQRLSATHVALRQELTAAQHELQRLHAQVGAIKHEKEQQMRGLMDKMAKMEHDLQAAEPIKTELQEERANCQNLNAARQDLITKVQSLTKDYQRTHFEVQQIPALMAELESLRQEYQHCRATYDYEKKLYHDHYETLQVMENNYVSMVREVEKLRAELATAANIELKTGAPYAATIGYKVNEVAGHQPFGQNAYDDGYNVSQAHGALATASPHDRRPTESSPARSGYETPKGPAYEALRGPGYETAPGSGYEVPKVVGYNTTPRRSASVHQGQVAAHGNSVPYVSTTPPSLLGGYNAHPRGGNRVAPPNVAEGGNATKLPNHAGGANEAAQYRVGNTVQR